MAEIEFFAIEEEIGELVRWLLDRQCNLIPDCHYESSHAVRLTELPEIQRVAESAPHFFVIREDWLESSLNIREVTTAEKHFFYVEPRTGGPTLQFYWGRHFEREGRTHLSATWLSMYNWYEDSVSGERKKLPEALRDFYSAFAKTVRAGRRKIKPGKREFWVSPPVEDLVRAGAVLVGLEGMPVDQVLSAAPQ
jgi:hypothetical protein